MFASRFQQLSSGQVIKFTIENESSTLSYAEVTHQWQNNKDFRAFFIDLLLDSPFYAFRWETPPVTIATADQPFEFVLIDSPEIVLDPDPSAFAEHFQKTGPGGVIEFPNLGGDAILIAPCPDDSQSDYAHIAAYLRNSQGLQQHLLWKLVGSRCSVESVRSRFGSTPQEAASLGYMCGWMTDRSTIDPNHTALPLKYGAVWTQQLTVGRCDPLHLKGRKKLKEGIEPRRSYSSCQMLRPLFL